MLLFHIYTTLLRVARKKTSPKSENKQSKDDPFQCEKPLGERYMDFRISEVTIYLVSMWAVNIGFSFSKRQAIIM